MDYGRDALIKILWFYVWHLNRNILRYRLTLFLYHCVRFAKMIKPQRHCWLYCCSFFLYCQMYLAWEWHIVSVWANTLQSLSCCQTFLLFFFFFRSLWWLPGWRWSWLDWGKSGCQSEKEGKKIKYFRPVWLRVVDMMFLLICCLPFQSQTCLSACFIEEEIRPR